MSWTNWFENPCTDVLPNNDVEPLFRWVWYSLRAWCKMCFSSSHNFLVFGWASSASASLNGSFLPLQLSPLHLHSLQQFQQHACIGVTVLTEQSKGLNRAVLKPVFFTNVFTAVSQCASYYIVCRFPSRPALPACWTWSMIVRSGPRWIT